MIPFAITVATVATSMGGHYVAAWLLMRPISNHYPSFKANPIVQIAGAVGLGLVLMLATFYTLSLGA